MYIHLRCIGFVIFSTICSGTYDTVLSHYQTICCDTYEMVSSYETKICSNAHVTVSL